MHTLASHCTSLFDPLKISDAEKFPALCVCVGVCVRRSGPPQMLPCVWHLLTLANLLLRLLPALLFSLSLLIAFCSKLGLRRVSWRPCDWQAPLSLVEPLPHSQSNGLQQASPAWQKYPLPLLSAMSFVWPVHQYRLHTLLTIKPSAGRRQFLMCIFLFIFFQLLVIDT